MSFLRTFSIHIALARRHLNLKSVLLLTNRKYYTYFDIYISYNYTLLILKYQFKSWTHLKTIIIFTWQIRNFNNYNIYFTLWIDKMSCELIDVLKLRIAKNSIEYWKIRNIMIYWLLKRYLQLTQYDPNKHLS